MIHPTSSSLPAEQGSLPQKQRRHHPPGPPWYTAAQNTFSLLRQTLDFLL